MGWEQIVLWKSSSDSPTHRKALWDGQTEAKYQVVWDRQKTAWRTNCFVQVSTFSRHWLLNLSLFKVDSNTTNRWFHLFSFLLPLVHSLLKRIVLLGVLKTKGTPKCKRPIFKLVRKTWKNARKLTSDIELRQQFYRTFILVIDWTSASPVRSFCWKQSGSCWTVVFWISNLFEVPQLCHQQQY